jgi:hypothetical protein
VTARRNLVATVTAFLLGAGLLVPFDHAATLAAGVVLLFAFVVLGVFTIADPDYLAAAPEEPDLPRGSREGESVVS